MGMYTEFHFNSALLAETPVEVLAVLRHMLDDGPRPAVLPDHPLFTTDTWWGHMLLCDSYYFDADTHSTLRFDDITGKHYLCIRCNLKNYNGEIAKFVDWIAPYLDRFEGEFLGFSRYEETEQPDLIFAKPKAAK